ncbi:serine/threonine-protein phosphatase, partial [Micromonospora azadirachtae]
MNEPADQAREALIVAPAHRLVDAVADVLAERYGVTATELFQVDYRLAVLLPLGEGTGITAPGHPAWRCFDHQEPVLDGTTGYFPVTMRGEQRGVLRLAPVSDEPAVRDELAGIATTLAHELAAVAA